MNKYILFMLMVFFLVLMTIVVDAIDETVTENIFIDNVGRSAPGRFTSIIGFIWNYVSLFFRIIFFQVNGIPPIFNLIIFYPLTAGTLYMFIDIVRGNG